MKSLPNPAWVAFVLIAFMGGQSFAQTFAPTPNVAASQAAQLQELTKKIEEQNAKIDMLSQHILKLEFQLSNQRPGVMIGESAPSSSPSAPATSASASSTAAESSPKSGNGNG